MDATATLLRRVRAGAGLSQAELAVRVGSTQAMGALYESGRVSPSVATLHRLLAGCGQRLVLSTLAGGPVPMAGPVGSMALWHRHQIRDLAHAAGAARVRVFGSVARGTDTNTSDLDLLVDFPVHEKGLLPLAHLADQISGLLGVPVDVAADAALADDVARQAHADAVAL